MAESLPKILVIVGPTASGKSDLAVRLAKILDGEIVSADSRQVYRGLDIGTGKVTNAEMQNVPHHLLDVADPKRVFSVARYRTLATRALRDIRRREKLPIVCGGTGFYIDSLLSGTTIPNVQPNPTLRKALSGRSADMLFRELLALDPIRAASIDRKNPVRLIRAIEIARALGHVPIPTHEMPRYDILTIGIRVSQDVLRERIHDRLLRRMRRGMIAEAKRLHASGLSFRRMEELGLEYRYLSRYLRGELSKSSFIDQLEREILAYAKRQMTWFKRNKEIHWFTLSEQNAIDHCVREWQQHTPSPTHKNN